MKSKIYSYLINLFLLMFVSCNIEHFDTYPIDEMTEGSFYKTESDFESALNSAYFGLKAFYQSWIFLGDIAADNCYDQKKNNNFSLININESNVDADNSQIQTLWTSGYNAIARTNIVIEKLESEDFNFSRKDRFIAEAKFIRSLLYFNMVRIWGDVPLILKEIKTANEAFGYGREPKNVIYEQIISDLKDIENILPANYESIDDGRATKWAVKSLLGEIYLTLGDYPSATSVLAEVTSSGKRLIETDNYQDIFKGNNEEVIFSVQYTAGLSPSQSNPFLTRAWPNVRSTVFENSENPSRTVYQVGEGVMLLTSSLFHKFENSDIRKSLVDSIALQQFDPYSFVTLKYYDMENTSPELVESGNDIIVYRYADVLLMYAEALNETDDVNGAFNLIKEVRDRANISTPESFKSDKQSMKLALENERQLELYCEGHRWFDLLRTGRLKEVMNNHFNGINIDPAMKDNEVGTGSSIQDFELVFPLPKYEVDLNPDLLIQNQGY